MQQVYNTIASTIGYAPEDFIAARVHRLLSHDSALRQILNDRIVLTRNPEDIDYTVSSGPILHIAPDLSSAPVEFPAKREYRFVEVLVALFWEEVEWKPFYDGPSPDANTTVPAVSMGTILTHCWYTVNKPGNRSLAEKVSGVEQDVVSPGHTNRRVVRFSPFRRTETGPLVFGQALVLVFRPTVNVLTGKIANLET